MKKYIVLIASACFLFATPVYAQLDFFFDDVDNDMSAQDKDTDTLQPDENRKGQLPRLSIEEQEKPEDDPADILNVIAELPPDIQDELIDEGDKAFKYCKDNYTLSQYYNCSCFTFKFIEARYELGPDIPFMSMISRTDTAPCVFAPAIAGHNFNRCERIAGPRGYDRAVQDRLCKCVSDKMVEAFSNAPNSSVKAIDYMFKDKFVSCSRDVANPSMMSDR